MKLKFVGEACALPFFSQALKTPVKKIAEMGYYLSLPFLVTSKGEITQKKFSRNKDEREKKVTREMKDETLAVIVQ